MDSILSDSSGRCQDAKWDKHIQDAGRQRKYRSLKNGMGGLNILIEK